MAFVALEKAFDRMSRKVIWWALRKLGMEEWIMQLVQGMYTSACPCCWGIPWRVWSEGRCSSRHDTQPYTLHYSAWSLVMRVPMILLSSLNHSRNVSGGFWLKRSNGGERTKSICRKDKDHDLWYGPGPPAEQQHLLQGLQALGAQEMQWAQVLDKDPDYRCTQCQGTACPLDGRPWRKFQVGPDKLEVVASFCYLGDMLSAAGGCEVSTTTHAKTAWNKFKELLPVLSSRHLSFKTCDRMYSSCVWSTMLHVSETWPLTKPHQHLQQNDGAIIRQICNVKQQLIVTTRSVSYLHGLALGIRTSFWRRENSAGMEMWKAPVVQSRQPVTYRLMETVGLRPKMTWKQLTESGSSRLSILTIDIPGDLVWDLPCVQQASYLEGGPLYLHVNQKSYDYDDEVNLLIFVMIQCKTFCHNYISTKAFYSIQW